MTKSDTPSWQKKRGEFNHDWLKNRFIPACETFQNLLAGKLTDSEFEEPFLSEEIVEWERQKGVVSKLIKDFEDEMSPKTFFRGYPLCNCEGEVKQWLGKLVHSLWLNRYSVSQWISDAETEVKKTDMEYIRLKEMIKSSSSTVTFKDSDSFRQQFTAFLHGCRRVAGAIEKFPNEVKVT